MHSGGKGDVSPLTPLTLVVSCPSCRRVLPLEACEVLGCPADRVACPKCHKVFWPVPVSTQRGLFDGEESGEGEGEGVQLH